MVEFYDSNGKFRNKFVVATKKLKKKKSRKSLIPAERKKEKNKWKGGRRGKVVR